MTTMNDLMDGLFDVLLREAERHGMTVTKIEASRFIDPETGPAEMVVTQWVDAPASAAMDYWDKVGAVIERWSAALPEHLRDTASQISVEVRWRGDR